MIGHARDSRFPPPWMVQDQNDDRFAVACFYYDRRAAANLMTRAERRVGESRFANCRYLAACRQGFADRGNEDYSNRGPSRASIIRLASATISSVRFFSRLEGLSANGRVDPGAKIEALQPFPTELTSIRNPLYSITVMQRPMLSWNVEIDGWKAGDWRIIPLPVLSLCKVSERPTRALC